MIGEYIFESNIGHLIIHPNLSHVRCYLKNQSGFVQLCPRCNPETGQYLLPFGYSRSLDSLRNIVDSLLGRILEAVSRFRENRASLLKLCLNTGLPSVEIMGDCPALISLIASRLDAITPVSEYTDTARYLVRLKREHILSYFTYPSSKSIIKMMRKIPASDSGLANLEEFRKIIEDGNPWKIKVLQHIEIINWLVLHLLSGRYIESHIRPSFVLDIGGTDPDEIFDISLKLSENQRILASAGAALKVPRLTTLCDLERVHDRLVADYMEVMKYSDIVELKFPEPPLPGVEVAGEDNGSHGIFPLENGLALRDEGLRMNHCIATYAHEIAEENGLLYAYHVDLPYKPLATVLIRRNPCSWIFEVEEIRGFHNAPVDPDVELYVHNWLSKQGVANERDERDTENQDVMETQSM